MKDTVSKLSYGLDIDLSLLKEMDDCSNLSFEKALSYLAETASCIKYHPDWTILAGRLEIERLKLNVPSFRDILKLPVFSTYKFDGLDFYSFCLENADTLESFIVPERDYNLSFFAVRTLEKTYLLKIRNNYEKEPRVYETPQHMYLRVAAFLHFPDLDKIKEYYDLFSLGYFTHATPTLANAGLHKGSLASCYLLTVPDDLRGIADCIGDCMMISKNMGGIGLDVSSIRHSKIGHFGESNGIVPMLKVFNSAMQYADQGGGRRKGVATIFLQPWHVDFADFLELKRAQGSENLRARDLFYSVWSCDLFMKRIKENADWCLFCPKKCPGLTETYGEEFEKLYLKYENEKRWEKRVSARGLWNEMLKTQIETGMPFLTHKDTANNTSNQKNLGIIRSSNLCQEICEVSDEHRVSSCNLASICLNLFVNNKTFNFEKLGETVRKVVRSLNRVVDRTYYPLGENGAIKTTNLKYRPLGIGVQGLADTFMEMDYYWESEEAKKLNIEIFACIYYYAVDESTELAKKYGSYEGFVGSPASKGLLKPDLINIERLRKGVGTVELCKKYDWEILRKKVVENGLRNSLLVALMPTASTAQIRGNVESIEPISSNFYRRGVLSGNFIVTNRYMVNEFKKIGFWTKDVINTIIKDEGSVQNLDIKNERMDYLKKMFKTAFEIKQKVIVDMSIDRSFYVDQSQSLNIHMKDPTFQQLTSLHFYAWENCLTTGMYYLRTTPAVEAVKFTVETKEKEKKVVVCTDDICVTCQS